MAGAPKRRRLGALHQALCRAPHAGPAHTAAAAAAGLEAAVFEQPALSPQDLQDWETNGYTIIKNAASKEDCAAVVEQICACMGMSSADPESWYKKGGPGKMVGEHDMEWDEDKETPIHHGPNIKNTQAQWNIRQSPKVYTAFSQIYGTRELWCNPDGVVTFKPPARAGRARFKHVCSAGHQPWFA